MSEPGDRPVFSRVLVKLSGEALMGDRDYGQDPERIQAVARSMSSAAAETPR